MIAKRSDDYRYSVDLVGADITPLASVEAFVGPLTVRVHNISQGGIALGFDDEPPLSLGDFADISVSIRERAFPIQVEVKGVRGKRLNCAFVNPTPAFQSSLQEFLQPKFLGDNIHRSVPLSERAGAVELVEGALHYDAYLGQNQTGFFVWTDAHKNLLKIVGMSRELVFEWSRSDGLRTGRLTGKSDEDIQWDKVSERTLLHYFADIMIAWFRSDVGSKFVDRLMSEEAASQGEALPFPEL